MFHTYCMVVVGGQGQCSKLLCAICASTSHLHPEEPASSSEGECSDTSDCTENQQVIAAKAEETPSHPQSARQLLKTLQGRLDLAINLIEPADSVNPTFTLPIAARSNMEALVRASMAWVDESRTPVEFQEKIDELDQYMASVMQECSPG